MTETANTNQTVVTQETSPVSYTIPLLGLTLLLFFGFAVYQTVQSSKPLTGNEVEVWLSKNNNIDCHKIDFVALLSEKDSKPVSWTDLEQIEHNCTRKILKHDQMSAYLEYQQAAQSKVSY